MKKILITIITLYQMFISPLINQILGAKYVCRYSPTCSAYAKQVINEYGIVRGLQLTVKRLLSCQPFAKSYGHI